MIFVQLLCALLLVLTPWFPTDEWACSSEGFVEAESHLQTDCTADTDCSTITSYALYAQATCSENNACDYSERKACHTPINSAAFHRVMVIVFLACSPLHIGIVATLFGRQLQWKGSRLIGAGTVLVLVLQQSQLVFDWFGLSLGTRVPFCDDADWAGFVCHEEDFTKIYFKLMSVLGFVLLCVFARIAVWVSTR
jgi:hypothetical protein